MNGGNYPPGVTGADLPGADDELDLEFTPMPCFICAGTGGREEGGNCDECGGSGEAEPAGRLVSKPSPENNAKRETLCTKCGWERRAPGQRYCANCHAEYMRQWRAQQAAPECALRIPMTRTRCAPGGCVRVPGHRGDHLAIAANGATVRWRNDNETRTTT